MAVSFLHLLYPDYQSNVSTARQLPLCGEGMLLTNFGSLLAQPSTILSILGIFFPPPPHNPLRCQTFGI
jgi:hypothetical protein